MALNIKNEETVRLAKELAALTGESLTTAVTAALRERLERHKATEDFDMEAVLALLAEMRSRFPPGYLDQDFDALLYDENGLPK